ncbi:hypothetical protein JKF63_07209 [Porcisia hertigi]|uniref:Uncharacterized protein n=1 Tax=Porcisia hertigi TaxID=2761500 RepID=A0A836LLG6_9TRYP|nr:hypothetical protein JKF63_07209 [Porcisia hertigi]
MPMPKAIRVVMHSPRRRMALQNRFMRRYCLDDVLTVGLLVQLRTCTTTTTSLTASIGGTSWHSTPVAHFADAAASSSPPRADASLAPPSPVEVHQVIARAVQSGKWEHAVRLLLGALHSHCVPLAETYQLALLAALRGGGWRASVQLTTQVATSALSTSALYHTAADLLLVKSAFGVEASSNSLDPVVLKELVPLMLADATQHVVWRPRHREAALRALKRAKESIQMSALFRRWTFSATLCCVISQSRYSEEEATLLMEAFSLTGDWCSAEALRSGFPQLTGPLLVKYVYAFAVAVQRVGTSEIAEPQEFVPWEMALDVAASGKQDASLQAAVAELLNVTRHTAAPADGAGWWWATSTSTHAKLTELHKRAAISVPEAARFLAKCHLTTEEAKKLLDAVRVSGVLNPGEPGASTRHVGWVNVVLLLSQCCPHALVSTGGCADGLVQLLPHPHLRVRQMQDSGTPHPLALWQYVVQSLTDSDVAYPANTARQLVYTSSVWHYVRHASLLPAQLAKAEDSLSAAMVQQLSPTSRHITLKTLFTGFAGKPDALCVLLRTVSTHVNVPPAERCVGLMLCKETSRTDELVDVRLLSFLKPLDALGTPEEVCEAVCAAGEALLATTSSPSSSAQLVCLAVWYICHQLQRGVSIATLRSALRRTDALAQRLSGYADALLLLSAHLQWCWGASLEALRTQAVPVLARREEWSVLPQLLNRCPLPLSAQERRILARCERGVKVAALQNLVTEQRARAAWDYWQGEVCGAIAEQPLPTSLHDSFVSLLLAQGFVAEAHAVLECTGAPEAPVTCTTWSHAGLRVYDYARRRRRELGMPLEELWNVAALGEEGANSDGSGVRRREASVMLSLYAGLALVHTQRAADGFRLVSAATDYVRRYDATHHHCSSQLPLDSTALHKTDAQLATCLPDYVQCVAPRLVSSALGFGDESSSHHTMDATSLSFDSAAISVALQTATSLFPLTSTSEAAVIAWSGTVTQLYTTATACATDAMPAVLSLGQRLLLQAARQNVALGPSYLRLVLEAGSFSTTLLAAARQCLLLKRGKTASSPCRADVAATAAFVAHALADRGNYSGALEWVEEFELWPRVEEAGKESTALDLQTVVDSATQLSWLRAAHWNSQRLSNQRAALCQSRRKVQDAVGRDTVTPQLYSRGALDLLIGVEAWEEALDAILHVASASPNVEGLFSEESMMMMEVRDTYLCADVLNSVMLCVARCAPWRTTVQAWILLTSQAPLLPWATCATAMTPSIHELLRAMGRQGALPHEIGTVVAWMVMQMDLPTSATSALCSLFADCIDSSSSRVTLCAWTAAETQLCAEIVVQLRRLAGEQRVQEAELAIAESQVSPFTASSHLVASLSEERTALSVAPLARSWLPPGLPPLSSEDLDTLAVVAPLLLLASAPQLESLARQHLGGRFQAHELKALLYFYKQEILQRVSAVRDADALLVQYLSKNATLLVLLSQWTETRQAQNLDPSKCNTAAAEWMVQHVFDGLFPLSTAEELWRVCQEPATKLAGCRWSAVAEGELCEELLRRHGRLPTKLSTAPQLTRQDIAHYWSRFHRVLLPEMHFGPLELCCLATYAPALAEARAKCPDITQPVYSDAVSELATHAYMSHFCPGRVPVEDTLSYLRRPHSAVTIAAVMTSAFKKLKVLHTQLFEAPSTPAHGYRLPFEWSAVSTTAKQQPTKLDLQYLAAATRRVAHKSTPVTETVPARATNACITSPLLRQWMQWVTGTMRTGLSTPLPHAASLLLVEWTKEALQSDLGAPRASEPCSTVLTAAGVRVDEARALWREVAQAGKLEMQQCRCRELGVMWKMLTESKVWRAMDAGHVAVLRKLVCPSKTQITALPPKHNAAGHHGNTSELHEQNDA